MIINKKNQLMYRAGKVFLAFGISLLFSVAAFAQPTNDLVEPDDTVPFDGGVTLLVAAGVAYGAKQWKQSRKESEDRKMNEE